MNKKDILEIKRRFKKEACTFTRMCGCYVDADHNKITKIGETFLNLEDEEFYKYLEIARKMRSRKHVSHQDCFLIALCCFRFTIVTLLCFTAGIVIIKIQVTKETSA